MNIQRESVELLEVAVIVDGETVTGFDVCVTPSRGRPETWEQPLTIEGKTGVLIRGLAPGRYRVWARVVDNPEIPVISVGYFAIE